MDAFARMLAAPVPHLPRVEDHTYDPAEGVAFRWDDEVYVRPTSDPRGQGGGVPEVPTRPSREVLAFDIRPFAQEVAHRFVAGHVEIARRPSNTPGFSQERGSMQVAYQPAVTTRTPSCDWDTIRVGPADGL